MATIRQQLIQDIGRDIGTHNFDAWCQENDKPLRERYQKEVDEYHQDFSVNLVKSTITKIYAELFENTVESFINGYAEKREYNKELQRYLDNLSDVGFKRLAMAILKEAEKVTGRFKYPVWVKEHRDRNEASNMTELKTDDKKQWIELKVAEAIDSQLERFEGFKKRIWIKTDIDHMAEPKGIGFSIDLKIEYDIYIFEIFSKWNPEQCTHSTELTIKNAEGLSGFTHDKVDMLAKLLRFIRIIQTIIEFRIYAFDKKPEGLWEKIA